MRAADPQRHPKQNPRDKLAFWQSKALLSAVELVCSRFLLDHQGDPKRRSRRVEIPRAGPKEDTHE
jgi:hypothetical protein